MRTLTALSGYQSSHGPGLGAELRAERGHSSYGDRYIDGPYGLHVDHLVRSPVPGILAPPPERRGGGLWTTVAEGL